MRLSTKGRYATRIMVYLARRDQKAPASRQEIADAENISAHYVEQLLARLKVSGLVRSHRGAKGGFTLAKSPEKISVLHVLEATEGTLNIAPCLGGTCGRSSTCVTKVMWEEAANALTQLFLAKSIGSLATDAERLESAAVFSYQI